MKTIEITAQDLRKLTNEEIIALASEYPYPSQWLDKKAMDLIFYVLAEEAGKRYQKTGKVSSFKTRKLRYK